MRRPNPVTATQRQIMLPLASGEGRLYEIHGAAYLATGEDHTQPLLEATFRSLIRRGFVARSKTEYPRIYYTLTEKGRQCLEQSSQRRGRKSGGNAEEEEEIAP